MKAEWTTVKPTSVCCRGLSIPQMSDMCRRVEDSWGGQSLHPYKGVVVEAVICECDGSACHRKTKLLSKTT